MATQPDIDALPEFTRYWEEAVLKINIGIEDIESGLRIRGAIPVEAGEIALSFEWCNSEGKAFLGSRICALTYALRQSYANHMMGFDDGNTT